MKKSLLLASFLFLQIAYGFSQGCATIRNISGFSQYLQTGGFSQSCDNDNDLVVSTWIINVNNRYYKSYKDFVGTEDINTAEKDLSINKSYSMDLSATHFLNHGWSLSVAIPIIANSREASKEHG